MKILLVHNFYQRRGGEDAAADAEARSLEAQRHRVVRYERYNGDLRNSGLQETMAAGIETVWASRSHHEVKALIVAERPDVAHFHNTFPLISPAAYYACAEAGVPVVQTLHNYRLLCPSATLLRKGKVCEACVGSAVPWPGVVHACYRGSRSATAATAAMLVAHRAVGTWRRKVDVYVALSEFARRKFIEGGLPSEKIVVKPNFLLCDPGTKTGTGAYALFIGRLSEEKGPRVMLNAWVQLSGAVPLKIAGDGPLKREMGRCIENSELRWVELLGQVPSEEIAGLLHGARFLVLPSVCYENFPLTIEEAFACGVPVIASRLGAMEEIVEDGKTGLHFAPGDPEDLAAKVGWAWNHPEEMVRMGRAARVEYETKYRPERNYEMLMEIYRRALVSRGQNAVTGVAGPEVLEN